MREIFVESAYFGVVLSVLAYAVGMQVQKRLKLAIFNPILIAVALTIAVLTLLGIDYPSYQASAKYLSYLLTPATVCLAIPLYEQIGLLKKHLPAILLGIAAGALSSLISIFLMALLLRMSRAEYATLLMKSVTAAVGAPVAERMGGNYSIATLVIIFTGLLGNALCDGFLKLLRVTHPVARGVAIGTSSHVGGTARAMELGEVEGAMSSLSIAVSGLMTVVGASVFIRFI